MDPLTRALRYSWTFSDASADAIDRVDAGTVLRTPSLPDAWSLNALRLEHAFPGLDLAGAEDLAAAHLGTPYLQLLVEDEPTALRLLDAARGDRGWNTERHLLMALTGTPPRPAAPTRDGRAAETTELMAEWMRHEGQPEPVVEQLVARTRREHAVGEQRHLVADHEGRAAAMCTVRLGDGVAQLEDVYVRASARGAGLGRAVVAAGARLAAATGADPVFIVADDQDWPKRLYAKLGFTPLGRRAEMHRKAGYLRDRRPPAPADA